MRVGIRAATLAASSLVLLPACSKENNIDASQTTNNYTQAVVCEGPVAENAMCEAAPSAPPGALCVYGHCRTPCASDDQCDALVPGSICLPGADGSGCRLPQEASCGEGAMGCPSGLVCADAACRAPCSSGDCILEGLTCVAGTCVGHAIGERPEPQMEAGPEPEPEAGPDPEPAEEAGPDPEPAEEAGPDPEPEPAEEAGPDPEPEAGADAADETAEADTGCGINDVDCDGWAVTDGDCCDTPGFCSATPALVNPGAFEYLGNAVDDDCDGVVDNLTPPCDSLLATSDSGDALDYAKAVDLCQVTTESPATLPEKKWGVIAGGFSLADEQGLPHSSQRSIRSSFGSNILPMRGARLAVLSTGAAAATGQTGPDFVEFQPGSNLGTSSPLPSAWLSAQPAPLPKPDACAVAVDPGTTAHDPLMLRLRVRAPTNARSFSLTAWLMTAEFPERICTPSNDVFLVLVDTPAGVPGTPNPPDGNVAFHRGGSPPADYLLGANLALVAGNLFSVCKPTTSCSGTPASLTCLSGTTYLQGTGFETEASGCQAGDFAGGGTGWLTIVGSVVPGEILELRFVLWDTGDGELDSLVLLDNFVWNLNSATPGTF